MLEEEALTCVKIALSKRRSVFAWKALVPDICMIYHFIPVCAKMSPCQRERP